VAFRPAQTTGIDRRRHESVQLVLTLARPAEHQRALGRPAGLQPRVGLGLVLLIGDCLAGLTPFPDPGFRREQNSASPALFGDFRIERKYSRLPRQKV